MLSLGDRNPKGTTILPRSKAYLIVPVAGNFKQFPQPLCQVELSSLSGWYANQRHREIRRALGIAQADLHSQSSPPQLLPSALPLLPLLIIIVTSLEPAALSPPMPWLHLHRKDSKTRTWCLTPSFCSSPFYICLILQQSDTYYPIYVSIPAAEWTCLSTDSLIAFAFTFPGQNFSGANGWEASDCPRMNPILWIFEQMGRVWAHSPMMLKQHNGSQ